ncbi:MAG: hypothetical protein IJI59_04920, partial [Clostridia bacterium]|nr:hypothetical protein [Clostridia bacterium]
IELEGCTIQRIAIGVNLVHFKLVNESQSGLVGSGAAFLAGGGVIRVGQPSFVLIARLAVLNITALE